MDLGRRVGAGVVFRRGGPEKQDKAPETYCKYQLCPFDQGEDCAGRVKRIWVKQNGTVKSQRRGNACKGVDWGVGKNPKILFLSRRHKAHKENLRALVPL
jgi:hypothetical protein